MKTIHRLIHGFALLHVGATVLCRMFGVSDTMFLTLLTMSLCIIICLEEKSGVKAMVQSIIFVNIAGFGIGMGLAALLEPLIMNNVAEHAISTLITTEILGWFLLAVLRKHRARSGDIPGEQYGKKQLILLLLAITAIYFLRIGADQYFSIRGIAEFPYKEIISTTLSLFFFMVLMFFVTHVLRERLDREREKAEKARYQYMMLKQQMNPHFLFNCLNVLNGLVTESPREEASHFIHNLSSLYRYILTNENEDAVSLREEMEFAGNYADLMKTRWPKGLDFKLSVREEDLPKLVIPCSLQVCIENAIKHNSVSAESPLEVSVSSDGSYLRVSNPVSPRVNAAESTGVGINSVRQQYLAISGKDIRITQDESTYTIELPLL